MRGRKIRIDMPQPDTNAELEISETPEAKPTQVIVIDGEALQYESSVQWECFPGNVEVLINDDMFVANKTFSFKLTAAYERERVFKQAIDKIWLQFDADNNGSLDRDETKIFLQTVLGDVPPPNNYDDSKFDQTFKAIDKNGNGRIEKNEMFMFLKAVCKDA